jgi:hypothetical protein
MATALREKLSNRSIPGLEAQRVEGCVVVHGGKAQLRQAFGQDGGVGATRWAMRFRPCGPW